MLCFVFVFGSKKIQTKFFGGFLDDSKRWRHLLRESLSGVQACSRRVFSRRGVLGFVCWLVLLVRRGQPFGHRIF